MKKGYLIFTILLIMVIGYAATQVRINIEGKTKLSENIGDFKVYMANLKLNGTEIEGINETKDGYVINIPSKGTLEYDIVNDSTEYDVETSVECEETNEQKTWTFDYTGGEQTFVAPTSGTYRLETWGAQGGCSLTNGKTSCNDIGYGGYSVGVIYIRNNTKMYINVGGSGANGELGKNSLGGYNGGGLGTWDNADDETAGGGGGATHIATLQGLLSTLEKQKENILIVSGGGGGLSWTFPAGSGGGYVGGTTSTTNQKYPNQTEGFSFGRGEDASGTAASDGVGGGGGGFYGGYMNNVGSHSSGGGGSGYIGNALLTEKSMYCYNCTESNEEQIKTISTTCANEEPTENCAKKGNGYARIIGLNLILPTDQLSTTIIEAKDKINNKVEIENTKIKCNLKIKKISRTAKKIFEGPTKWAFDYTGEEQIFNVPISGTYKLEIWGAQGGYGSSTGPAGGYGGYSEGIIYMLKNENIYVNVGGQGETSSSVILNTKGLGGYNGGGYGTSSGAKFGSGGGGATHIATSSGLLSTLEKQKETILIVSGGGGAGFAHNVSNLNTIGGSGGGYKGGGANGGNQENSGTNFDEAGENSGFGIGGSSYEGSGGGGGFYGGGLCVDLISCGGGSGYIGNPLLMEKSMYCYNCEESSEEETKTISTTCANEEPTENCAKKGNGYARITLLKTDLEWIDD